jgi:hypothetical protein
MVAFPGEILPVPGVQLNSHLVMLRLSAALIIK